MYLFEFTKSLLVKANFYDQIGAYIRYAAQDDPGLQDLLDGHCDSAGTVVMFLLNEKNSGNLTLNFAIEDGMYKDEVTLNKILADATINNPKTVKGILALAVADIEYLKTAYKQHDWLDRFTIIADRLEALKSNLLSRYGASVGTVENASIKPLMWTGGVAVLGTLFNELRTTEKNSAGNPFIDATAKETADFICTFFVDEEGNAFERDSVARYLSSDKQAKRNKVDVKAIIASAKD